MQVPFLLYKPGKKPQRFTHWTSHYDVAPTIMADLFHCKNPSSDFSIGKHLHDQANRDWLLVGSNDSFAIIQPDKITSIYQDRSFDLTDARLNPLDASAMDTGLINEIVLLSNAFRKK
jgi:membrane-anchored protein YejM (alkaline phosphatase superfamily)